MSWLDTNVLDKHVCLDQRHKLTTFNFYEFEKEINLREYSNPVLGLYTCL